MQRELISWLINTVAQEFHSATRTEFWWMERSVLDASFIEKYEIYFYSGMICCRLNTNPHYVTIPITVDYNWKIKIIFISSKTSLTRNSCFYNTWSLDILTSWLCFNWYNCTLYIYIYEEIIHRNNFWLHFSTQFNNPRLSKNQFNRKFLIP